MPLWIHLRRRISVQVLHCVYRHSYLHPRRLRHGIHLRRRISVQVLHCAYRHSSLPRGGLRLCECLLRCWYENLLRLCRRCCL